MAIAVAACGAGPDGATTLPPPGPGAASAPPAQVDVGATSSPATAAPTAPGTDDHDGVAPPGTAIPSSAGGEGAAPPSPAEAATIAQQLTNAERAVRDPATPADQRVAAARVQQVAYRTLGRHQEWDNEVDAALPEELRAAVRANVAARRDLARLLPSPLRDTVPAWKIVAPAPEAELLSAYHQAEAATGVGWQYLAAINLVESGMGRIRGLSTAGAQGPMQFLPSTFAEYGEGGDIDDPGDSILAAARLLARNGFDRGEIDNALYRYNNSNAYVRAIRAIADVIAADPGAYSGYYLWDVYYATSIGVALLPIGYESSEPIAAADYFAAYPQRRLE
ncbi:MAG: transglycosylase SLT domain-containing protein [Acidimicrobiia bacterium]